MTVTAAKPRTEADIRRDIRAAKRGIAIEAARTSLIEFAKVMMPDPQDEGDASRSAYAVKPHHILLAEALERVERGECLRLAVSMPPQHGKSELGTRLFPAWAVGKNPKRALLIGCYNQDFANEMGGDIREYMEKPTYRLVFPKAEFRTGSRAKEMMKLTMRGQIACVGRKGSGTGKPADIEIIDDPLKNAEEAESPTIRKELHNWYRKVFYSRARTTTAIIIVHTRWHEDDLIGRLCDPDHPDHDPELAKAWTYINIPAVIKDDGSNGTKLAKALGLKLKLPTNDLVKAVFGDMPMTALWGEEFSLEHLASAARQDPPGFNALYMGRPTPEDGDYFKADHLSEYTADQLPKSLRYYGASDHAVTEDTANDENVIGCVGIDSKDDIWVLPDLVWERMQTDRIVDELIEKFNHYKPLLWWMEDENISKSFGPFLRKAIVERKAHHTTIEGRHPTRDKRARARSIQGRMSLKRVHFPKFAPWWRDARSQLLKFPYATHDDFVDWLALIGLGLMQEIKAPESKDALNDNVVRTGSIAWIKAQAARERKQAELRKKVANW